MISYTVLVVDDNPDEFVLTRMVLAKIDRGIRVETVSQGQEALAWLEAAAQLPSLILLDIKRPGISGLDTLRAIRAAERLRTIPVIMFTSSSMNSDESAAYAAGANGFLHKGVDIKRYMEQLKGLFQQLVCPRV